MPVLIITDKTVGISISRTVKSVLGDDPVYIVKPNTAKPSQQWVTNVFVELVASIEKVCEQNAFNTLAIVELGDDSIIKPSELNPLSTTCDPWASVVGLLILSFPEIHWCFYTYCFAGSSRLVEAHLIRSLRQKEDLTRILELYKKRFSTLFDATGLRALIRSGLLEEGVDGTSTRYAPVRNSLAAVIDDEEEYAYLNAYTAYKFGFRVQVLTSFSLMNSMLRKKPTDLQKDSYVDEHLSLVFEDIYLEYPDYDPTRPLALSQLRKRDECFSLLREIPQRIFMTVGHHRYSPNHHLELDNLTYIRSLRSAGQYQRTVHKPAAGIFDIWTRSGMKSRLARNDGHDIGFEWLKQSRSAVGSTNSHSAPGRLLLVAHRLLNRARNVLATCNSVPDAIYGATLALEAQEYLSSRTPTTSIETIALKHQLEVTAECMFYGVEYNMDVRNRLTELRKEITSVGVWFSTATRKYSQLNAEIRITSKLLQIYRERDQFDEEQTVLVQIRKLQRHLWYRQHRLWAWLFYPMRCYVEFLLRSLPRFALALMLWIITLTFVYGLLYPLHGQSPALNEEPLLHGLSDAVTTFLGMQPPHDVSTLIHQSYGGRGLLGVTIVAIVASFVHLGIFISHVYAMITRR